MSNHGQRRGSIFGGFVLILIGVLFLIHFLEPGFLHLGEIVRYWPVLLILWGLARLWDYGAAKRAGQPAPRTVSGSDLLLVLVVIVGLAALVAYDRIHRGGAMWDGEVNFLGNPYTFTNTLPAAPVAPASLIELSTPRGNVTVRPQDAQQLSVMVTKTVNATGQNEAQSLADRISVAARQTARGWRLEPKMPSGGDRGQVSYDVSVFPKTSVSASTGRGDISINGITGDVSASAAGEVDISDTGSTTLDLRRGDARIHSAAGNVLISGHGEQVDVGEVAGDASINGQFFGPVRVRGVAKNLQFNSRRTAFAVSSLPGRFEMDSGQLVVSDTPGNVTLETRDKDVEFENVLGQIHIVDHNGTVEVRFNQQPQNPIDISNRSGDIELVLPDVASFSIDAVARSGDITSDFETPTLKLVQASPNSSLQGTVGSGSPRITLNTSYGTIHIRRAGPAMPMPPAASTLSLPKDR